RNCGDSRYLAKRVSQSDCESGGMAPTRGCHSVMDRPEWVKRVMPPTTTVANVKAAQMSSHVATARKSGSEPDFATNRLRRFWQNRHQAISPKSSYVILAKSPA